MVEAERHKILKYFVLFYIYSIYFIMKWWIYGPPFIMFVSLKYTGLLHFINNNFNVFN